MKKHLKFIFFSLLKVLAALIIATLPMSTVMLFVQSSNEVTKAAVMIGIFVVVYLFVYDLLFTRLQNRAFINETKPEDMQMAFRNYFKDYTLKETITQAVILLPFGLASFFAWLSTGKIDYASIACVIVVVLFPAVSYFASKRRIEKEVKKIIEVQEMRKRSRDY